MSFMFCLSKFISIPILTEWLMKSDILVLDSALTNKGCRPVYLKLMNEYFNLFIDSEADMNLIEVCGWSSKFGVPCCRLNCLVRCRQYDWNMLKCRKVLMVAADCVLANVSKLQCYHYNAILESAQRVTDLCLVGFKIPYVESFAIFCSLLNLKLNHQNDNFIVELLHQNPMLTSLDIHHLSDSILRCIVVHCTKLKVIKCEFHTCKQRVLLILSFHCRPSLCELPKGIPQWDDDESENDNDLVVKTILWYKGAQLTQLFIDVPRLVRNYKLFSEYPRLRYCIIDKRIDGDSFGLINFCRSHINGYCFYGQNSSDKLTNQLMNSLDLTLESCLDFNIDLFSCLRSLSLFGCSMTKEMFCSPGAYRHLQSVAIYNSHVDVDVLICLLTGPNLIEINLSRVTVENSDSFEDHYAIITSKVSKLTLIGLTPADMFVAIVKRCRNLTQLNVHSCYEVTTQHLLTIFPYCRKLITLMIASHNLIDDTVVDAIHNNCLRCKLTIPYDNLTKYGLKLVQQHNRKFE